MELKDLLYRYTNAVVTRAATGAAGATAGCVSGRASKVCEMGDGP